jgi:hypothetical protein
MLTELTERLPVVGTESVEQKPSVGIGERFEDFVHPLTLICNHLVACQAELNPFSREPRRTR